MDQLDKRLLAEQHRNTRHDAVDKIQEIRERWAQTYNFNITDNMFNEITGAIMNLKQREPIPFKPESQESKEERAQIRHNL